MKDNYIILFVALICFAGGAFVMENWHAERSAINASDIKVLHEQLAVLETRQLEFMASIEEHHIEEAVYMAELQAQLQSIKNDIGGM